MLIDARHLRGLSVHAVDGELGTVEEFYFDDETWGVRFLTVQTGGSLGGLPVLISPVSVSHTDWERKRLDVTLTKAQVKNSPSIDAHRPISRQHEAEYMGYFGYPYYWGGASMWGPSFYPQALAIPAAPAVETPAERAKRESPDSHLRSVDAVNGYGITAADGDIGHVDGFLLDDVAWGIRYIEAATKNWWPGKKVLFAPAWVESVSWLESKIHVGLTRDSIRTAPEYADSTAITRGYEDSLYLHYGKPPYWLHETGQKPMMDVIGV